MQSNRLMSRSGERVAVGSVCGQGGAWLACAGRVGGGIGSVEVDFNQTAKVDGWAMQDFEESDRFSFWSHEASQGSDRGLRRARPLPPTPAKLSSHCAHTKTSSRNERKRLAGLRSREKKKSYVGGLEERVRELGGELQAVEEQLARCKDSLAEALSTSSTNANEHAFTYAELERNALAEDPDLDRVNLLIDLVQVRVGANGRERQAKLDYNFKQIVNCMFPASYRYLLNSARRALDVFAPDHAPHQLAWTAELFLTAALEPRQVEHVRKFREELCGRRLEAVELGARLRQTNQALKRQGEAFERKLGDFREDMSAIQCAKFLLFAERNKLRKEFAITDLEEQDPKPTKRRKPT